MLAEKLLPLAILPILFFQQPEQTLPVILDPDKPPVIMKKSEAEKLLKVTRHPRLKAAIEIALITAPKETVVLPELPYGDFHRERWQRQPLQCTETDPNNAVVCRKN